MFDYQYQKVFNLSARSADSDDTDNPPEVHGMPVMYDKDVPKESAEQFAKHMQDIMSPTVFHNYNKLQFKDGPLQFYLVNNRSEPYEWWDAVDKKRVIPVSLKELVREKSPSVKAANLMHYRLLADFLSNIDNKMNLTKHKDYEKVRSDIADSISLPKFYDTASKFSNHKHNFQKILLDLNKELPGAEWNMLADWLEEGRSKVGGLHDHGQFANALRALTKHIHEYKE